MKTRRGAIDFAKERETAYQRVFSKLPLLTSPDRGWNSFYLAYDCLPPGEILEVASKQHSIAILTDSSTSIQVERTIDSCFRREQVNTGDIVLVPANISCRSHWDAAGGVIFLGFEPNRFSKTINETFDRDRVELIPHFATADPLIYQMGLALKKVLEMEGANSRLYAETMSEALFVHLLQHYTTQQLNPPYYADGLPQYKLNQVVDYIKAHLQQNLGLEELAAVVQMSSHYFCQRFKESTGISPHQFVIRCRVERAKELLLQKNLAIADIARSVGFADQSHLYRHFKRLEGITPKTFQQQTKTLHFQVKTSKNNTS
jgi:AraC family transcriptional regulator